ncbi:MAG: hypothetical protein ACK5Z2_07920 [Bacteroidota bacterium]
MSVKIISLEAFILAGYFGGVELGMSKAAVVEILGEPIEEIDLDFSFSALLYGNIELHFYGDMHELVLIQNDWLDDFFDSDLYRLNAQNSIDVSFLRKIGIRNYSTIKAEFIQNNIPFLEKERDGYDEIILESGVTLDFENWKDEGVERTKSKLNGIRLFDF